MGPVQSFYKKPVYLTCYTRLKIACEAKGRIMRVFFGRPLTIGPEELRVQLKNDRKKEE